MRIHHLACGELRPWWMGNPDPVRRPPLANHCLLIESARGLILVDTGFGMRDVMVPRARLSRSYLALMRPRLRSDVTAVRQVRRLGFDPRDVQHIILSHLDCDRAGGLDDFPEATIHLRAEEVSTASAQATRFDRRRYRPQQWSSRDRWRTYATEGDMFHGFHAVRQLDGLPPEILLVPLSGHTPGHAGVAICTPTSWYLYAGDAYTHHSEMELRPRLPRGEALLHWLTDKDRHARTRSCDRLRSLANSDVVVFSAQDRLELDLLRVRVAPPPPSVSERPSGEFLAMRPAPVPLVQAGHADP